MTERHPAVGVAIATRDRRDTLLATLDRITSLPERPPAVVVDNGSTDGTAEAVRRAYPKVRVVSLAADRGAGARTLGARLLETPLVAFSDDDSWWAPGALAKASRLFGEHPAMGLLAARVLVGAENRPDPTCGEMSGSPLPREAALPGPPVLGFVACGSIVRRGAFLSVGGFPDWLGVGGEEQLLALDLASVGWKLAYVRDVVAHHHPAPGGHRKGRRRTTLRNAFWITWLRGSPRYALAHTLRIAAAAVRAGEAGALVDALRRLPWAYRERRPMGPELEARARMLEGRR